MQFRSSGALAKAMRHSWHVHAKPFVSLFLCAALTLGPVGPMGLGSAWGATDVYYRVKGTSLAPVSVPLQKDFIVPDVIHKSLLQGNHIAYNNPVTDNNNLWDTVVKPHNGSGIHVTASGQVVAGAGDAETKDHTALVWLREHVSGHTNTSAPADGVLAINTPVKVGYTQYTNYDTVTPSNLTVFKKVDGKYYVGTFTGTPADGIAYTASQEVVFNYQNQYLSVGGYHGSAPYVVDTVTFEGNSLLVANGYRFRAAETPDFALTFDKPGESITVYNLDAVEVYHGNSETVPYKLDGTHQVEIDPTAQLLVSDAHVGETYNIVDAGTGATFTGYNGAGTSWNPAHTTTNSPMIKATPRLNVATGTVTVTTTLVSASRAYPKVSSGMVKILNSEVGKNNVGPRYVDEQYVADNRNAHERGVHFLSRAIDNRYLGYDRTRAAATMEGAARMVIAGAVPQMTMAASTAASNAVAQRTSMALPTRSLIHAMNSNGEVTNAARDGQTGMSSGDMAASTSRKYDKNGFAMWVMPLFQHTSAQGLRAGEFDLDYNGGLGGIALGADYTLDKAFRFGVGFNIGGGFAEGKGDFNKTTNDLTFWGVNGYLGWADDNLGLSADVGYTQTYNKLKQKLPGDMRMRDPKADVKGHALTAGARAEYRFETAMLDVTPHVGARYTYLQTDRTTIRSDGDMMKANAIAQNIWTFPVGVMFSREIDAGDGWYFKPMLDLAVVPAVGDINAKQDIRFTGTSTTAQMETQTMDYISYMGGAGLEIGNENFSLGVNYNLLVGEHATNHGVFGTLRVNF